MFKHWFDATFWKFIVVGVLNTLVGTLVMFCCYNLLSWSYWWSSAMNYIVGSVISFFLNKSFTFGRKENNWRYVFRFVVNVSVCYVIAYGLARPLVKSLLLGMTVSLQDNLAFLVGMGLFVVLNYIGQRFWTFRS